MTYEHTTYRDAKLRAVPALGTTSVVLLAVILWGADFDTICIVPTIETTKKNHDVSKVRG